MATQRALALSGARALLRQLELRRKELGKQRDLLRGLMEEYSSLEESCSGAMEDLGLAIDRLSEYA